MNTSRREFLGMSACAAGSVLAGCQAPRAVGPKPEHKMMWGELVHFGMNFWHPMGKKPGEKPFYPGGYTPEQAKIMVTEGIAADHVRFDEPTWQRVSQNFADNGVNTIVIDVGEILRYPSHPELAVKGSWSPDKLRDEVRRLRGMGFEVIPKLNFSSSHDEWLGEYHRMLCTRTYYQVVADLIRDVNEVFEGPRLFHAGLDEEIPQFQTYQPVMSIRSRPQWWKDLHFYQREIEKTGARMWIWTDFFRHHDEEEDRQDFVKNMPKDILQGPWWYQWINHPAWDEKKQVAVRNYLRLSDLGYEFTMCGSNCYACDENFGETVDFCKARLNQGNCKGFLMAPWIMMHPILTNRWEESAALVKGARARW